MSASAVACSSFQPRRDLVQSRVSPYTYQLRCACIVCTLMNVQFECNGSCMQPCPAEKRSRANSGVAAHFSEDALASCAHFCMCSLSASAVACSRVQPRRDLVQSRVSLDTCQFRCACIVCTLVHVQCECKCSCMQPCPAETRSRAKSGVAGHMSVEMRLHRVHTCACAV